MRQLNYFLGKVCTIMVSPTSLPMNHYTQENVMLQFSGFVDFIDDKGLQITNLAHKTKNFFFFPHIVGICEEQVLDADDPQVEIIKEAAAKKEKQVQPAQPVQPPNQTNINDGFIDIESLEKIADAF